MAEREKDKNTEPEKEVKEENKKAKKPESITIPLSAWEELTQRIGDLERVADKSRLANIHSALKKTGTVVKLSVLEDKLIVKWGPLFLDEVNINQFGVYTEKQMRKLYFEDGSEKLIEYLTAAKAIKKIEAKVVGFSSDGDREVFSLELPAEEPWNGRKVEINKKFVN